MRHWISPNGSANQLFFERELRKQFPDVPRARISEILQAHYSLIWRVLLAREQVRLGPIGTLYLEERRPYSVPHLDGGTMGPSADVQPARQVLAALQGGILRASRRSLCRRRSRRLTAPPSDLSVDGRGRGRVSRKGAAIQFRCYSKEKGPTI